MLAQAPGPSPFLYSASALATTPLPLSNDPDSLAFLRERIFAYGAVMVGIGAFGLAMRALFSTADDYFANISEDVSLVPHVLAMLVSLGVVIAAKWGPLHRGFLLTTEALGVILGSTAYIAMGTGIPVMNSPGIITVMALFFGFMARAVYVPSPARRTALLGAILAVPLAYGVYRTYSRDPHVSDFLALHAELGLTSEILSIESYAFSEVYSASAIWLMAVGLCTLASRTLYGLRRTAANFTRLGQYTLERKLGEGGMGEVYLANHSLLRRPAAVKLLPVEKAGAASIARFEREVQRTAELQHPNTITVFDYGRTPEGVFYYAMEFIDGATFDELVQVDGPQSPERVRHLLLQAVGPLIEAHNAGLIHRDIKPANMMVRGQMPQDLVKVMDFGLVKDLSQNADPALSQLGQITGTPQYMAPESIRDPLAVDARADLYALGAVAYYLLTGSPVFEAATVVEVCSHHLHTTPEAPSVRLGSELPRELEELILSCLEKDPELRPQSAREVHSALLALELEPWRDGDAEAWWRTFGGAIGALRDRGEVVASAPTLAVDLRQR